MSRPGLFILVIACSGQPAPAPDWPAERPPEPRVVYVTPDAAVPAVVGASCAASPCGPDLTCDLSLPGGACTAACDRPGAPCGTGTCVEYPTHDACRASCSTTADCRADEGYACDPVWKGCVLANSPTIAPRACPPPPGFGRDPAFAPPSRLTEVAANEPTAVLADDRVVVISERSGTAHLAVTHIDAAGRIESAGEIADHAAPALARDGSTLLVAMAGRGSVAIATSTDRGRTWSAPRPIAERECASGADCAHPAIAAGNDVRRGERVTYVAYAAGGGLRVRASRDGGKTFGPAVTALAGVRGSLAITADGTLHVVALRGSRRGSYGAGDHRIWWTSSVDGGRSFARPIPISRDGERLPFYFGTPRIEVDSARRWIYVAYTRGGRDGLWDLALVATRDKGKTWVRSRIGDTPACGTYLSPQLALDPRTGGVHASWYDSRGPRITHGVCADGLRWCRQLGRLNDVPFAGLSLSPHARDAAAESHALLVDPARRQLHAVWAQATTDEPARIFHARAKLR